jgi:hypothetical protein
MLKYKRPKPNEWAEVVNAVRNVGGIVMVRFHDFGPIKLGKVRNCVGSSICDSPLKVGHSMSK